jgi:hypothetical protein
MTGREFHAAASEPKELKAYDADHALDADARADRRRFLADRFGLAGSDR